jgi:hypothetical protein
LLRARRESRVRPRNSARTRGRIARTTFIGPPACLCSPTVCAARQGLIFNCARATTGLRALPFAPDKEASHDIARNSETHRIADI